MKELYLIFKKNINNYQEYLNYILYYFKDFEIQIVEINQLQIIEKKDIIFFDENYHPFKDRINLINSIQDDFYYLSTDKKIYYVSKDNYNFNNNYLDIKQINQYLEIFDINEKYNYIDHEENIDYKILNLQDLLIFIKLKKENKLIHLYNKEISIKIIDDYINNRYVNKKLYNQIIIIDDYNINNFNLKLLDFECSRYTLFINIKYLNFDNEFLLLSIINKIKYGNINLTSETKIPNKTILSIFFIKNYIDIQIILNNILLYYEYIVFNLNEINNNTELYNKYLKHYNAIIINDIIIIPTFNFLKMNILNIDDLKINKTQFYDLIKSAIINDSSLNYYINDKKYKKSNLLIEDNYDICEKILFNIKDYKTLLNYINKKIDKTYDFVQTNILYVKKITAAILTQKEDILNEELLGILNCFNEIEQLKDIELLVNTTKFEKIKKSINLKIFEKLIDNKSEDYNLISMYIFKILFSQITSEDMIIIINKLNSNKLILDQIDKHKLLVLLLKNLIHMIDKIDVINLINLFIKDNYNIENIESIDNFLELYNIINEDIKLIKDNIESNNNIIYIQTNQFNNNNKNNSNINEFNKNIFLMLIITIITKFDVYYKSFEDYIIARDKIYNNLIYLKDKINIISNNINLNQIVSFNINNFHLSYQGVSSKKIFEKKCEIFRMLCPDLNYKINTNFTNKKIKILFHGSQLNRIHSVYKDRHQIINQLSLDSKFDVYYSTFDPLFLDVKFTFGNAKHIILPLNLNDIKNIISNMKLDIIIYCEIGMEPFTYFMSFMKLAKIQCNTWGHSDTSGIDTIDYFFSSKLYELDYEKAQKHYSEKLILQNSLCTHYIDPLKKYNIQNFINRNKCGFTDEVIIYFCAQSLFKFNPLFDDYLIQILNKVDNAILIMSNSNEKNKFIERFNNKNITARIHFFPGMNHYDYMNLMYNSDIILDVYPFGGCNSSLEAFSMNKVIVTQPSDMINGRFTTGFYKKMQLNKYICKSKDEYINFAIKLGKNKNYRLSIEKLIKNKKNILFSDNESIQEWKDDLINIINNKKIKQTN
jgi:predicted O-linked N-acetylglucosamine transferase (SPINDLY family)